MSAPAEKTEGEVAGAPPELVEVRGLAKHFTIKRGGPLARRWETVKAVNDISFDIPRGRIVSLVGESGSGKTTAGRAILRLIEPTSGAVRFDGVDITGLSAKALRPYRKRMQIVFQDPFASLNPRLRIEDIVGEALDAHGLADGRDRRDRIVELLRGTGLDATHLARYPHELSGGQRQRIGIARALAVRPEFIVADEPISALDVSIQAQVLNLLLDLKDRYDLTLLMIAHDLGVVEFISDEVIVMYLGTIVERGPAAKVYGDPQHPYTQALLSAIPAPDPAKRRRFTALKGEIPSPIDPPSGCVFRTRCPLAVAECAGRPPPLKPARPGHLAACIRC
ncbi:MAG: ABC transporter ATP-binding protein [Caulobacterales bacterium]|nr:ABC transporter ATP-binding protein [Caulobacterales bacterium]